MSWIVAAATSLAISLSRSKRVDSIVLTNYSGGDAVRMSSDGVPGQRQSVQQHAGSDASLLKLSAATMSSEVAECNTMAERNTLTFPTVVPF